MAAVLATDESAFQEGLARWAADHASRYPEIGVAEYAPDERPEQRIGTFKSPARAHGDRGTDVRPTMLRAFENALGERALSVVDDLRRVDGSSPAPIARIEQVLSSGRSVALLTAHAEGFEDIGTFSAALALASSDPEFAGRNGVILNKVMSRELFRGQPMVDRFALFSNVYWVVPDTANTRRWGLPDQVVQYVNGGAMKTLMGDLRRGVVVTYAPAGSVMTPEQDGGGHTVP